MTSSRSLQVQLVTNVFRKTSNGWRLTRHHASDRDVATVKSAGSKQTLKAARELPGGGSSLLHNFVDKTGGVTELSARLFRVVNGEMRCEGGREGGREGQGWT